MNYLFGIFIYIPGSWYPIMLFPLKSPKTTYSKMYLQRICDGSKRLCERSATLNPKTIILRLLEAQKASNHLPGRAGARPSLSPYRCSKRLNEENHVSWETTETRLECVYLMHEEKPVCLWWRNDIAGWLYKDGVRWKSCTQQRLIVRDR